jgi:hypothetical protein
MFITDAQPESYATPCFWRVPATPPAWVSCTGYFTGASIQQTPLC